MKLRRTHDANREGFAIEALVEQRWYRLDCVEDLHGIAERFDVAGDLATDILAVLQLGETGWSELTEALIRDAATNRANSDANSRTVVQSFLPASFREFTLYEAHFEGVARAHVERYMPGLYRVASAFERLTGKTFPAFKPNKLWYQQPIYYYGSHLNFYSDGDEVLWPEYVQDLDYELELAAIVSRPALNINEQEAAQAIGGFVLVNDFSARGKDQRIEMQSGCGPQKSKHFANSMASVVVTADEILGKEDELKGRVKINGTTVSECEAAGMRYSFAEIVAFLSRGQTVYPGEIIASGTLPGASGIENGRLLSPGDRLTLELDGVGQLENTISAKPL